MVTPIEAVWNQIKASAAEHSARGEHLSREQAKVTVSQMLREARVAPWPPPDIIDFYASELVEMVDNGLQKNTSARAVS
jgi:hypothetical protein